MDRLAPVRKMNAATISGRGAALLLACALSPNGYAQTDDGSNENANDDGSVLSAVKAQAATNRFDVGFSHLDLPLLNQASI